MKTACAFCIFTADAFFINFPPICCTNVSFIEHSSQRHFLYYILIIFVHAMLLLWSFFFYFRFLRMLAPGYSINITLHPHVYFSLYNIIKMLSELLRVNYNYRIFLFVSLSWTTVRIIISACINATNPVIKISLRLVLLSLFY